MMGFINDLRDAYGVEPIAPLTARPRHGSAGPRGPSPYQTEAPIGDLRIAARLLFGVLLEYHDHPPL